MSIENEIKEIRDLISDLEKDKLDTLNRISKTGDWEQDNLGTDHLANLEKCLRNTDMELLYQYKELFFWLVEAGYWKNKIEIKYVRAKINRLEKKIKESDNQ